MKILILSCNTGQGHNSAALAVQEQFISMGHECILKDSLAYVSKRYSDSISVSYNKIVLHTPRAFGAGYRLSKAMKGRYFKSYAYAANMMCSGRIYEDIVKGNFDAVVCTHVFPGQAVTHVKHKYGLDIPLYIIGTDYSFAPFYNEIDAEKYFICMNEIISEFTTRGIHVDKIAATGIPVSDKFNINTDKTHARLELCLDTDKKTCLIMSGSMGYGNIYDLIDRQNDIDLYETKNIFLTDTKNNYIEPGSIAKNTVVSVYKSADGKKVRLIATSEKVTGKFSSIDDEET